MYQLTEGGREHARLLMGRLGKSPVEKAALGREIELELKRLFASKAVEKVKSKRVGDLTFYDASAFWGISPRSSAIELEGRIENFRRIVEAARKVANQKMVTFQHGGYAFGDHDLDLLLRVHEELWQKFHEEIKVIKTRTDERI